MESQSDCCLSFLWWESLHLRLTTENEEKSPLPIFNFPKINEEESFQINKKRGEIHPKW